jgi:hypothetical protein
MGSVEVNEGYFVGDIVARGTVFTVGLFVFEGSKFPVGNLVADVVGNLRDGSIVGGDKSPLLMQDGGTSGMH